MPSRPTPDNSRREIAATHEHDTREPPEPPHPPDERTKEGHGRQGLLIGGYTVTTTGAVAAGLSTVAVAVALAVSVAVGLRIFSGTLEPPRTAENVRDNGAEPHGSEVNPGEILADSGGSEDGGGGGGLDGAGDVLPATAGEDGTEFTSEIAAIRYPDNREFTNRVGMGIR